MSVLTLIDSKNTIYLSPETPYQIKVANVFGRTSTPESSTSSIGEANWTSSNFQESAPHFNFEINTVFGDTKIEFKKNNESSSTNIEDSKDNEPITQ